VKIENRLIAVVLIAAAIAAMAAPQLVIAPPAGTLHVSVVQTAVTTQQDAVTTVNLDVVGNLPFTAIKRYTVTISLGSLASYTGIDFIEVRVGVLSGTTAYDVRVLYADTSNYGYGDAPGTILPIYAGTNSFIRFIRGTDGLGDYVVHVNAYIEWPQ
jgi:hypothetical protein